jgi:hypothetical protein
MFGFGKNSKIDRIPIFIDYEAVEKFKNKKNARDFLDGTKYFLSKADRSELLRQDSFIIHVYLLYILLKHNMNEARDLGFLHQSKIDSLMTELLSTRPYPPYETLSQAIYQYFRTWEASVRAGIGLAHENYPGFSEASIVAMKNSIATKFLKKLKPNDEGYKTYLDIYIDRAAMQENATREAVLKEINELYGMNYGV